MERRLAAMTIEQVNEELRKTVALIGQLRQELAGERAKYQRLMEEFLTLRDGIARAKVTDEWKRATTF
jgi:hypothetical protein